MIACLLIEPFPLWLIQRRAPGGPHAVLHAGRVLHANHEAIQGGVQPGMPHGAALSRVPDLHTETLGAPLLATEWERTLESLLAYSPRIEGLTQGRALLTLTEAQARALATDLHARVGLAASRETATLAALTATPGHTHTVHPGAEPVFLRTLPTATLAGIGLNPDRLRRLQYLGVHTTGDLMRWTRAQQAAYLGPDHRTLTPYLHGPRNDKVALWRPPPELETTHHFEDPAHEPHELEPILSKLATEAHTALHGRAARRLHLTAHTPLGTLTAAREAKTDLKDPQEITRLATLTLNDTDAAPLGVTRLTLRVTGLHQPARQVSLWPGPHENEATHAVLRRYPHALVRLQWHDPHAYATDHQYQWVDYVSGEPRPARLPTLTPTPARTPLKVRT